MKFIPRSAGRSRSMQAVRRARDFLRRTDLLLFALCLTASVLGIVITAPLGAFLMDTSAPKLLSKAEE